jgi:hypothetical protein
MEFSETRIKEKKSSNIGQECGWSEMGLIDV